MFVQNFQDKNNVKFSYDYDHDVLYLYFGEPKVSYDDEAAPGIYIRFSEDDEIITGAVIMDFKKKDVNKIQKYIPINIDFTNINQNIH